MNEILIPNARLYAARHELELIEPLGSGKDGIVLVAKGKVKAANVAVKALGFEETYRREKQVFQRLAKAGAQVILGFNVPQLLGFADDLHVIEMTIVSRPFVLDFAGAYLESPPPFPDEIWEQWELEKQEQFEGRWPKVQKVMDAFQEIGVYLLDVSPGNIGFVQPP